MDSELPDVSILQLDDPGPPGGHLRRILNDVAEPSIPEDIAHATGDRASSHTISEHSLVSQYPLSFAGRSGTRSLPSRSVNAVFAQQ